MLTNLSPRRKTLLSLLIAILLVRLIPHLGELYALYVYPPISKTLSLISSIVPFSLDEWIVIITLICMIIYPFCAKHKTKRHIFFIEIETLLWLTVWFYLGWGLNYYRDSFFTRLALTHHEPYMAHPTSSEQSLPHPSSSEPSLTHPTKSQFLHFLTTYTDSLNATYTNITTIDKDSIIDHIKSQYRQIPSSFGLTHPTDYQHPKAVAFNWLYSSVGVLGYMGPFADESHLNNQLFPVQYAFTYAHELAHLLSISSEAEANYWAYTTCTQSKDQSIRYSGYYGIMSNVFHNAKSILTPSEFKAWRSTINPRIIQDRLRQQQFWHSQYSPLLADIQDILFNALLKSNRIPDGTQNYDKVILMILSTQQNPPLHH